MNVYDHDFLIFNSISDFSLKEIISVVSRLDHCLLFKSINFFRTTPIPQLRIKNKVK